MREFVWCGVVPWLMAAVVLAAPPIQGRCSRFASTESALLIAVLGHARTRYHRASCHFFFQLENTLPRVIFVRAQESVFTPSKLHCHVSQGRRLASPRLAADQTRHPPPPPTQMRSQSAVHTRPSRTCHCSLGPHSLSTVNPGLVGISHSHPFSRPVLRPPLRLLRPGAPRDHDFSPAPAGA